MPGGILITGATSGLGRRVAERLAERASPLLVHGRSAERVGELARELGAEGFVADLSSLAEVRRLAEEVRSRHERIDVLVNNAGVIVERRETSADGHELTLAVNHLSHFLLTLELLPLIGGRVVHVSSAAQQPIDFGDPMLEHGYTSMRAYSQSKLAQVMFCFELAERGVTTTALHPATLMDTNMVRQAFGSAATSVEEGAEATLRLIADPALEGVSGRYFDGTREKRAHGQAYDAGDRRRLWELSERLVAG